MIAAFFNLLAAAGLIVYSVGLVVFADFFHPMGQEGVRSEHVMLFVGATLLVSLLHVVASYLSQARPPRLALVIGVAAAARLILLFGSPATILEGDPGRMRFDARLVNRGLNPYEFTPAQIASGIAPKEASIREPAVRFDKSVEVIATESSLPRAADLSRPDLRSTTPPLGHWVGSLADRFKPGSTRGLAFLILVADAIAIFFLVLALRTLGLSPGWLIVYAWCPVLLKELYVTMAIDAFVLPALALLVYCIASGRRLAAAVPLALAASFRPIMLLLVPGAMRRIGLLGLLLVVILVLLPLLPFWHHDVPAQNYVQGTVHTWRHYEYNSLTENVLRGVLQTLPKRAEKSLSVAGVEIVTPGQPLNVLLAKVLCGILVLGVVGYTVFWSGAREVPPGVGVDVALRNLLLVLVAMLLCTPVLHPWHALWLLPVLVVRPAGIAWIAFPALVTIGYVTHLEGPFAADLPIIGGLCSFRVVEFGALGLLLIFDLFWSRGLFGESRGAPLRRERFDHADQPAYDVPVLAATAHESDTF